MNDDMTPMDQIIQDAAFDWLAERNSGSPMAPDRLAAFQAWLAADPAHAPTLAQAKGLWSDLDWAEALNAAAFDHAPPLVSAIAARRVRPAGPPRRRPVRLAAMAAAVAAGLAAVVVVAPGVHRVVMDAVQVQTQEAATQAGEIRHITLADGSRITLGGRSSLRIRMARDRREVELLDGDAYFEVAPDPKRPFSVTSGGLTATAVGTAFEVNRDSRTSRVAVTQGHVRAAAADETVMLAPGQRARLGSTGPLVVETFDPMTAGRWRDQRAAFRDAPLGQVIEALDRYHPAGVVLADPALADLPVSAAFRLDQMEVALHAMTAGHDLELRHDRDGRLVIGRAAR